MPFWLRERGHNRDKHIPLEKVLAIRVIYSNLPARANCREQADKLRALCPMLANTPVETQGDRRVCWPATAQQ
eukprot:scaffold46306_cov13-Prasinocladus_malaysianus.AAC.1